ncbi:hypothetical protein Q2E61_00380 [Microbulbifer thermotolerans]|uniref:PEGA domain-containing protein n=1 Tax=Microbulbifer thermotolerans TaxID=252514 RepID=A0AB35HY98_MICTH|nr:hypothetical protein [Microbulbifer thermotolerans]MCX2802512.1 hypothetical protein [Microbulbifer thermotolerans]MCX2840820.1 hypothetical protein [Microbulbifer thermotolerans]WKT60687.1 hypothetical protein Q2E61_00380 [Microbulbifer thermotolerans]
MKKYTMGVVAASMLFASGCASILSDSSYPVTINSTPTGANFTITDEAGLDVHSGVTPDTITLSASDGFFSSATYTIRYQMAGYNEQSFQLKAGMDGWYIGNILFGGLIGMLIVDPATGAMWKLPESAHVTLNPAAASASSAPMGGLTIASIDQVPEEVKSQMIRVK